MVNPIEEAARAQGSKWWQDSFCVYTTMEKEYSKDELKEMWLEIRDGYGYKKVGVSGFTKQHFKNLIRAWHNTMIETAKRIEASESV